MKSVTEICMIFNTVAHLLTFLTKNTYTKYCLKLSKMSEIKKKNFLERSQTISVPPQGNYNRRYIW